MAEEVIIVPVDGATNIKLEVLSFETLGTIVSKDTASPSCEVGGLRYNSTGEEFAWFDKAVASLPGEVRGKVAVIAPVARGASGGLVGNDGSLTEVPGRGLTLSYNQRYPDAVECRFRELAGSERDFFLETGSIRDFPGSLTLIKRFVFEEMERPDLLKQAAGFGVYGVLMAGHFLGDDYLRAVKLAGNEHSYWMCHSGARDITGPPGKPSRLTAKIESFWRLVPRGPAVAYRPIGHVPPPQAATLGIAGRLLVVPGGHDTCLSHIPVMATFGQAFPEMAGKPVIQVDGGTWTMVAQIGGTARLLEDGFRRDILVQGTVDGEPVVTARYGGGNDFKYLKALIEARSKAKSPETKAGHGTDEKLLLQVLRAADCFVLPNINPVNHGTGPFPNIRGRIVNEESFLSDPARAVVVANLTTAITTSVQIEAIAQDSGVPIVITAGASKDPYFGRLLATLTGRKVYTMFDKAGNAVTETTTLGAAIVGKAAVLGGHPYRVDVGTLGVSYAALEPFGADVAQALAEYRKRLLQLVSA